MNLQQGAKGERPSYFSDPGIDKILSMTMALTGEFAVMRDRLDSLERMLAAGLPVSREALDAYAPDDATRAERDRWRAQFLDIVLRAVHQEREGLERRLTAQSYASVIAEVEGKGA